MLDALLSEHPDNYDNLAPYEVVERVAEAMFSEYSANYGNIERDEQRFNTITRLLNKLFLIEYEEERRVPWGWYYKAKQLNRAANLLLDEIKSDNEFIREAIPYLESLKSNLKPGDDDVQDDLRYMTRINLTSVYSFLAGMSLENLLKGFWILRDSNLITEEGCNQLLRHKHQLRRYADESGVKFTSDEYELLDRFTEYIEWQGKYPIHKKSSEYVKSKMHEVVMWGQFKMFNESKKYDTLYERLSSDLFHSLIQRAASELQELEASELQDEGTYK